MGELNGFGGRLLVIFDGRCGFCNRSVRWFLRRDRFDRMRFAPFESPKVSSLLHGQALHGEALISEAATFDPSTILVVRNAAGPGESLLVRSNAVIAMLRELPSPWPSIAAALQWIPRPLRDLGYRIVARLRFQVGRRLATCPLPTAEERARFL